MQNAKAQVELFYETGNNWHVYCHKVCMDILQAIRPAQMETAVSVNPETDKDELSLVSGADFELLLSGLISNAFAMPAAGFAPPLQANRESAADRSAMATRQNPTDGVVFQSGAAPLASNLSPKSSGNIFPAASAAGQVSEEFISKAPSLIPSHFRGEGNNVVQPLRGGDKEEGDVYDFTDDSISLKEEIRWGGLQTQCSEKTAETVQPEPGVAAQGKSALVGQATDVTNKTISKGEGALYGFTNELLSMSTSEETGTGAFDPPVQKVMFTEQGAPVSTQKPATITETLPEGAGLVSGRDPAPMQRILPPGTEAIWNPADKTPLPIFVMEVSKEATDSRETLSALPFSAPADPSYGAAQDDIIMKTTDHQAGQTGETGKKSKKMPGQEAVIIISDEKNETEKQAIQEHATTKPDDKEHPEFSLKAEAPFGKLQVDDLPGSNANIRALHGPEAAHSNSSKPDFIEDLPSVEATETGLPNQEISGDQIKFSVAQAHADIRINADNAVPEQKIQTFHENISVANDRFVITKSDGTSIEMTLQPEGLGKLEIEIVIDNGTVNAKIEASQLAGKELVERNISEVIDALSREGISIGGFSVSLKGGKGDDRNEQYFRKEGKAEVSDGQYSTGQAGAAAPVSRQGRINIFI